MKIKTSELSGVALDWAVAHAVGIEVIYLPEVRGKDFSRDKCILTGGYESLYRPSTDWIQGGPLIERFRINIHHHTNFDSCYAEMKYDGVFGAKMGGQTPLIAACRAIVAAKLGDEVDVPDGLV